MRDLSRACALIYERRTLAYVWSHQFTGALALVYACYMPRMVMFWTVPVNHSLSRDEEIGGGHGRTVARSMSNKVQQRLL